MEEIKRKIIVLDDDPTGVQTVHDVYVYTDWEYSTIREAFLAPEEMFFILTNSRSFSAARTQAVHEVIAKRIIRAAAETGLDYIIISRGDSTLRGHFPLETETLRRTLEAGSEVVFDGEILCPFFPEGGRYTVDNVHFVKDGEQLLPVGESEFAKDPTFGYRSSDLRDYVEEKTNGLWTSDSCICISVDELRAGEILGEGIVYDKLMRAAGFQKIIVNAVEYTDLEVFCSVWTQAINDGKRFIARSAAALPKILGKIPDAPLLGRDQLTVPGNNRGGIVIIGSHVARTTRQLEALKKSGAELAFLEFMVEEYYRPDGLAQEVARILALTEDTISRGQTAVIYTSRKLLAPEHASGEDLLAVSVAISDALTHMIHLLTIAPRFLIAKGGITSSDVGVKGLSVRKALVLGQIRRGIPVWQLGSESKFPGMPYIIFPGNVGGDFTLRDIVEELM